ncbi:MAG: glycosyltransferase family 2 protein, partial [Candidatus Micrarchaeaceae archaeon]
MEGKEAGSKNSSKIYVSVVIPTLNEEPNIEQLLREIESELSGKENEVIIVDGGSTDNTVKIAKRHGAKILHEKSGKGAALLKGFSEARGKILISMDADLSHRPVEMRILIAGIEAGYDICMGSRFISGGGTDDMPLVRVLGNKFFVFLVNLLFGSNYSDLCYGYRSFNKEALKKMELTESGFGIETEISIQAKKAGLKTMEIPSVEKKRSAGEAKLK